MMHRPRTSAAAARPQSLALLVLAWLVLQLSGIFRPGLLDDVDSVYIEIARTMLVRHDFVTPYIDGIRFFDKPPLMYWLAAAAMRVFGAYDWAARLPIALAMLALVGATYALGLRLFARDSHSGPQSDRGALYAALALSTALGPYLYTRFFIPDILVCLWMTLGVHLFLVALDRAARRQSSLWPSVGFAVVLALNLLTKGLIGLVFPIGFCALYLVVTRQTALLKRLAWLPGTLAFVAVALPWHVLAALRNPAIAMPPAFLAAERNLPARAGWAWFYLYNEHVARFLGRRVPHDYGQTPVWLFWLLGALWMLPWAAFLPAAWSAARRALGHREPVTAAAREAALVTTLWPLVVMVFFTFSSRQEYYSLPALPALALAAGGTLAMAERDSRLARAVARCHLWLLVPLVSAVALVCAYFAVSAPAPAPGTDLATLLATNPDLYNVSLGHLYDLTGAAMGLFRGPLTLVAAGMALVGVGSYLLRRAARPLAANLVMAAGMGAVLLAAHEGLVRFNPILGSKDLALAILRVQAAEPRPDDLIVIDGELTSGSSVLFYTRQPAHLVNGRVNGPWFGSFWPDAPPIFEDDASLLRLWHSPRRVFLLTYQPGKRQQTLGGAEVVDTIGGEALLRNR